MANSNLGSTGMNIWSKITPEKLVDVIATLGDRVEQLGGETWRLNVQTRLPSSLWCEIINKLQLVHNEKTRHSLYNIWHSERHDLYKLVKQKQKPNDINETDGNDGDIDRTEQSSVSESNNEILIPDPSLPLPERPNTRTNKKGNGDDNNIQSSVINETSFILTAGEWKEVFSRTHQKMKPGWTDIFYEKLTSTGIKCPVKFKYDRINKGKRKHSCVFFWARAMCTISICPQIYHITLQHQPDYNSMALFRVQIFGQQNHDINIETSARQLRGKKRFLVGKQANEIGPLAVFRERIEIADESLLEVGNYTGCETNETLKKAGVDYRKKMNIDENIFVECRIVGGVYRTADVTSTTVQGYIQVIGEMPFRVHLFSELQIQRYISYCTKVNYSYVHLDATGGILKQMSEQKCSLLYALIFKDGNDPNDTIPLGHAILTDHTVPSISYFLGNLAQSITQVKSRLILPSFFIIDFSAAELNAILQAFNAENINTHLNRCWNVLCSKYNTKQLRALSFIHFCCCHVIHAIARSLNALHIDKKIRRGVLHIFAYILCGNDIKQLYDILGSVINIFGDPNVQNAKENFERLLSLQLEVDEESVSMLTDDKKIFKEAKKNNEELKLVDEYFRSNTPIIHQSPFNEEAVRLYPYLTTLINNKSKYDKVVNPLFSPSIIRLFYRWWAYLPLWTGLLWNFEERYSNNVKSNISVIFHPIRHSNALIESYFRTLKQSILQSKVSNRPMQVIMELYRSVQAQFKANKFDVTQSSKGRKRRKKNVVVEEKWGKKAENKKVRTVYFKMIDKFAPKRAQSKTNDAQSHDVIRKISESEDTTTTSSSNKSASLFDNSDGDLSSNGSSISNRNNPTLSSSKSDSKVSSKYSFNDRVHSGDSMTDDERSEASINYDFHTNIMSSITSTLYPVNNKPTVTTDQLSKKRYVQFSSDPETIIDGHTLRWPKFGIKNAFFEGQLYNLTNTCPTDSALFALYYIYRTDNNITEEFDAAPPTSPYSTLVNTFHLAEKEGWDVARLSWLLTHDLLEKSDEMQSLFGSVDKQVFSFIKYAQEYYYETECSRPQCKDRIRDRKKAELNLFTSDDHVKIFEDETVDACQVVMAEADEMTAEEARKHKYRDGLILDVDEDPDTSDYERNAWLCDAKIKVSVATFKYGLPSIIIVNMQPLPNRNVEGYEQYCVRLRDMKTIIRISSVEYELRAAIHNKDNHFTATLVSTDGTLYFYDDLKDVKRVRSSTHPVVVGIYSQIYKF